MSDNILLWKMGLVGAFKTLSPASDRGRLWKEARGCPEVRAEGSYPFTFPQRTAAGSGTAPLLPRAWLAGAVSSRRGGSGRCRYKAAARATALPFPPCAAARPFPAEALPPSALWKRPKGAVAAGIAPLVRQRRFPDRPRPGRAGP